MQDKDKSNAEPLKQWLTGMSIVDKLSWCCAVPGISGIDR
jgi:hypothetical protein